MSLSPEIQKEFAPGSKPPRTTQACWWLMTILAVPIAGYGIFMVDGRSEQATVFGQVWLDAVHFVGGGIALLVGAFAFHRGILRRAPGLHRRCGMIYLTAVLASGLASLAMASQSMHGMATHFGFGLLGVVWLSTSGLGLVTIKRGDVVGHRRWMVRSYAACYAAVMLRLQLAPLAMALGDFGVAYKIVSWSCWVPNLVFAEWWLRRTTPAGRWRRKGVA